MPYQSLKAYLNKNKDLLVQRIIDLWLQQPDSSYKEFLLKTEEGRRRLKVYVSLFIDALNGNRHTFVKDQSQVGYARAVKGMKLENVINNIPFLMRTLWELLPEILAENELQSPKFLAEMQEITALLFENYQIIAESFVKTREEIINEQVKQLQALFDFTREIIVLNKPKNVADLLFSKIDSLFTVDDVYVAFYQGQIDAELLWHPRRVVNNQVRKVVEDALRQGINIFMDEEGLTYSEVTRFRLKRLAVIPIQAPGRIYGVVALRSRFEGFRFTEKNLDFLYQFARIAAVALQNIFMLGEIEQHRQELRLITSKMITIQEEERKRLAEDIHDSIAQSLTGISYKMQFCKETLYKNPEILADQFEKLIKIVDRTVDQSRQLIANLRPDLIDTIGLVAALEKYIESFQKETGIRVDVQLPQKADIPSRYSICFFRVAQEALMNVYKHAQIKTAMITLKREPQTATLVIADDGKGFDVSSGAPWTKNPDKLGLLSIKERIAAVGGDYSLHTGIGQGCRIEAKIFLDQEADNNAED